MRKNLILLLLALLPIGASAYTLGRVSVHDPSVVWEPNTSTYYIFGSFREVAKTTDMMNWTRLTLGADPAGAVGVPWKTSTSDNAQSTVAFNTPALAGTTPTGAKKAMPSFDAEAWSAKGGSQGKSEYDVTGNLWAPDVIYNITMNKWCMYMSVNGDNWYSSIVLLTADNIEGPYTYQGPVVISGFTNSDYKDTDLEMVLGEQAALPERYTNPWVSTSKAGYPNNIDPCVFYDGNNKLWMSYGSWSGGIFMLELDESTGLRDYTVNYGEASNTSDPYFGKKIAGGYYSSGEASYIEKIGSYYYLFLSYGGLKAGGDPADYNNGGYQMRVFRSENPDGPYKDPMGQDAVLDKYYLNFGAGSGYKVFGENIFGCYCGWGYQANGFNSERSQGHNSIIAASDDRIYLVYHTRFQNRLEEHEVRVHQVFQNEDGWLVAAPFEYTGESVTNTSITSKQEVADADIPGSYKLLIHRNKLDHTQKETVEPVDIQLLEGGPITGDYTGTWTKTANTSYVQITLGSNTYKGVMVNQTLEPTSEVVPAFTAVSTSDGVSIWGYKPAVADELPTPVYFNDFSSTEGLTQVGSGEFIYENSRFGQIYHNNPAGDLTPRTNYLKLPSDVLTHSGETKEMTIGFWINVKSAVGTNFFHSPVFSAYGSSTPGQDNDSPMFRCSAKGIMQINDGAGNWTDFAAAQNAKLTNTESTFWLDDQEWHYYTVTLTATTGTIYVDGGVVNTWTMDGTSSGQVISGLFTKAAANGYPVVCLGGNQSWNWADFDAAFGYDDIAIYNKALTPAQIAKIIEEKNSIEIDEVPHRIYFNDFSSTDGLTIVGNNGSFQTSENANYGQYYQNNPGSTPTYRENYLKLHSYVFSGINSTSEGMTVGMWVNGKLAHEAGGFFWSPLICALDQAPNAEGKNEWTMFYGGASTYLRYNLNEYSGGWCDFTHSQNDNPDNTQTDDNFKNNLNSSWLDDDNWHYYTVTLTNAEAGKATVYVDGVKKNSWNADFRGLFNTIKNLNYVSLGGNQYADLTDRDAAFAFDDFAVYDIALTADQIVEIIAAKSPNPTYSYTVNASYNGKTKIIASGEKEENKSVNVAYPRYILDGTTLYEAAATSGEYATTFTLSTDNQEATVTYNASTTSNVYYYAEAEDVLSGATSDLVAASNGKLGGRQKNNSTYTELVTLPAGTWQIATAFYVGNSGDHTVNFKVGDEVKWTFTKGASSRWYNGTSENIVLTESATVSVAVDGGSATGLDWIYIKSINNFETVGSTDFTTAYLGATRDYTLKKGETKVFNFKNYGLNTEAYQNWVIRVKEGDVDKAATRADFWDNILKMHLDTDGNDSADDWAVQSNDGGTSRVGLNWEAFKEDMKDANVEARVTYGNDGSLTINAVSTGAQSVRKYYVDNVGHVSGLTADLTVSLSVDHAWLEIISVESSYETLELADDGTGVAGLTEGWAGNITWNRSFTGGKKHTVCLPFDPTALKSSGKVFEFTGISDDKMVMTEVSATTLEPNKPYIFEPTADMTDITFNNVTVNIDADPKTTQANFTFQGTYTSKTTWTETELGKCYGFTAKAANGYEQGMFAKLGSEASAKPFRAYLQYTGTGSLKDDNASAGTRGLESLPETIGIIWVMANGTTAISGITQQAQQTAANGWYTLDGRRLAGKPSKKGVYVNNGQKVIIK